MTADPDRAPREVLTWDAFGDAAVLYEKPRSAVRCDYVWRRPDRWNAFPWSSRPPVTVG